MTEDIFIPYAVFCDGFTEHEDNTTSLQRVIDQIAITLHGVPPLPITYPLLKPHFAISFQAQKGVQTFGVEIRCTTPSGDSYAVLNVTEKLVGDSHEGS